MANFPIKINIDKKIHHFEVGEYLHHNGESCKFKVFEDGEFVVSFEPDQHYYLHVCQNPRGLNEKLIHLLAAEIESHHPLEVIENEKKLKS